MAQVPGPTESGEVASSIIRPTLDKHSERLQENQVTTVDGPPLPLRERLHQDLATDIDPAPCFEPAVALLSSRTGTAASTCCRLRTAAASTIGKQAPSPRPLPVWHHEMLLPPGAATITLRSSTRMRGFAATRVLSRRNFLLACNAVK